MSREKKIEILITLAGLVLSAIISSISFAFFVGRLTEKIDDLVKRVDAIEQRYEVKVR